MKNKPELKLSDEDGNIFFILGRAIKIARKNNWSEETIKTFLDDAKSGDYDHALQTCMKYFDVV